MRYSTKVSDAVHILAYIHLNPIHSLTSDSIAESIQTNPGCVRQLMSKLRRADLLVSVTGHPKPALAKAPEEITLLDVYRAVEQDKPLLHLDTHTNPECGVGVNIQLALQEYYDEIQQAAEQRMAEITLRDILDSFRAKADIWLKTASRTAAATLGYYRPEESTGSKESAGPTASTGSKTEEPAEPTGKILNQ